MKYNFHLSGSVESDSIPGAVQKIASHLEKDVEIRDISVNPVRNLERNLRGVGSSDPSGDTCSSSE